MQDLDYLQKPQIQSRIEQIKQAKSESQRMALIKQLFRTIQESSVSVVDQLQDGVPITNLDQVTTSFHNEMKNNTAKLLTALKDLKLSSEEQSKITTSLHSDSMKGLQDEFKTIHIKTPRDRVTVSNLDEIVHPSEIRINNLEELKEYFQSIIDKLDSALKLDIPAPIVNVAAPNITIPESSISIPEANFDPIIEVLEDGLKKLKYNNNSNPVFVRLTDIQAILDKLDQVQKASKEVMLGFPGSLRIQNATGGIVDFNSLTVSTRDDATQQAQFDYVGGTTVIYAGYAPRGVASSAGGWLLQKFTYDGNNNVTQKQIAYDTWNNRTSASYA